jgi:hypothetical protein
MRRDHRLTENPRRVEGKVTYRPENYREMDLPLWR